MPAPVDKVLEALDRQELLRLAHAAEHLLGGRPVPEYGARARRPRPGLGTEFLDYSAYRPGDELRRIDWRASARSERPVVRRHIEETRSDWMLCLDASASMAAGNQARWRQGVLLGAAYCHVLLHLGHRIGLVIFAATAIRVLPAGRGHQHLAKILRTLADTPPVASGGDSCPTACNRHLAGADATLLISDLLPSEQHAEALKSLRAHSSELHVLHVLGDNAAEAPGEGPAQLVDIETGSTLAVMCSEQLRKGAMQAGHWQAASVEKLCRRLGLIYNACPVTTRWSRNVASHLATLVRRRA